MAMLGDPGASFVDASADKSSHKGPRTQLIGARDTQEMLAAHSYAGISANLLQLFGKTAVIC